MTPTPATLSPEVAPALKNLAKNLANTYPASPRQKLGGYVIAARVLDKCRAVLVGTQGDYKFNCPLDKRFFDFAALDAEAFKAFVATGATDEQVAEWITTHAKKRERGDIVLWNNRLLEMRISELPLDIQVYMEDYIPQYVPAGKIVYRWFDVYDYEEGRL